MQYDYEAGKGKWYQNDNERLFIKALIELNYANHVIDELNKKDRSAIVQWHSFLKNELSQTEYQQARQASAIILSKSK